MRLPWAFHNLTLTVSGQLTSSLILLHGMLGRGVLNQTRQQAIFFFGPQALPLALLLHGVLPSPQRPEMEAYLVFSASGRSKRLATKGEGVIDG